MLGIQQWIADVVALHQLLWSWPADNIGDRGATVDKVLRSIMTPSLYVTRSATSSQCVIMQNLSQTMVALSCVTDDTCGSVCSAGVGSYQSISPAVRVLVLSIKPDARIDGTDGRMDTRPLHKPCSAYHAGSDNNTANVPGIHFSLSTKLQKIHPCCFCNNLINLRSNRLIFCKQLAEWICNKTA